VEDDREARRLAVQAVEHVRRGDSAEAMRLGRAAMALARQTWREDTQADVGMALAAALLAAWEDGGSESEWHEALDLLDHAITVFEPQRRLQAWTAMVTVAEINWRCGNQQVAENVFARVAHDLADPRWGAVPTIAVEADVVRGRAFTGLGMVKSST
jgi:hypothetical protein